MGETEEFSSRKHKALILQLKNNTDMNKCRIIELKSILNTLATLKKVKINKGMDAQRALIEKWLKKNNDITP